MNRKLFINFIKVNIQMMALFFMFIILQSNISFANVDITGTVSEFFDSNIENAPIRGIRVQLIDQYTGQPVQSTLTNEIGNYILNDIPQGNYSLEYRYGDVGVLDEFKDTDLVDGLTAQDILKYNGHDYIVSDSQEVTTKEWKKLDENAAQIFFVIDTSGSMENTITTKSGYGFTRLDVVKFAAKQLAKSILDKNEELNKNALIDNPKNDDEDEDENEEDPEPIKNLDVNNLYLGLISFSNYAKIVFDESTSFVTQDYGAISNQIDKLYPDGNTNVSDALHTACETLNHNTQSGLKIIIFLSDGVPTVKNEKIYEALKEVEDSNIKLYSLIIVQDAFGLDEYDTVTDFTEDELKEKMEFDNDYDAPLPVGDAPKFPTPDFWDKYYTDDYVYYYTRKAYLDYLYRLYAPTCINVSGRLVYKENADDLANCMTKSMQEWIEEKIIEHKDDGVNTHSYQDLVYEEDAPTPECGFEDKERRAMVDYYFSDYFHNNASFNNDNMAAKSYLFKAVDDINSVSKADIKNLSEHTYMTITFKDINILKETKTEVFNLCLKRRSKFALQISNKAIAVRVTLNSGQVIYNEIIDYDKEHLFFRDIDPELLHGALIEVEYKVDIKNLSPHIRCNYLELASYLPPGLYLSENSALLSNPDLTNFDAGWTMAKKLDLIKFGYINHDNADLLNRYISVFKRPISLGPGETYSTNFVLSTYVTNIDDFVLIKQDCDKNMVEVIGYQNTKNRRMEQETENAEQFISIGNKQEYKSAFTGVYPGDAKADDPDFAKDQNSEAIIPPTGNSNNIQYIVYAIIILLSTAIIIIKIKSKK